MINYAIDDASVKPRHRRRKLDSGVVVQFPRDYPYRAPISGSKTVADWIAGRFERNFPGLEASLLPPDDRVPLSTPLSHLRGTS